MYLPQHNLIHLTLAEEPGVARGKKFLKKKIEFFELMSVDKKNQPNRSSRLAGYTQHIYECLILLYRITIIEDLKPPDRLPCAFFIFIFKKPVFTVYPDSRTTRLSKL